MKVLLILVLWVPQMPPTPSCLAALVEVVPATTPDGYLQPEFLLVTRNPDGSVVVRENPLYTGPKEPLPAPRSIQPETRLEDSIVLSAPTERYIQPESH